MAGELPPGFVLDKPAGGADLPPGFTLDDFKDVKRTGNVGRPEKFTPSGDKDLSFGNPDMLQAHPLLRGAKGAAAPALGGVQLLANLVGMGGPINERLAETEAMTQRGRKEGGSTGFDWWSAGGNALSPVFMGAAKALPATTGAGGRIGQGSLFGLGAGLTEPVTNAQDGGYFGTKGTQAAMGAITGAALPAAWEGAKVVGRGVRNVVQPYMGQWGADAAAGRLARSTAGDKAEEVITALQNAREFVPGSRPTAGQAAAEAGSAEFSALQKLAAERKPTPYAEIERNQNAARIDALRTIGGTKKDLADAVAQRATDAKANYGLAYQQQIAADPQLAVIAKNPYFKDAIPDAMKLAEAEGISPKTDLTRFLHFVKISMDKQIGRVGDTALSNTERGAVNSVKSELVDWLAKKNPAYDSARAEFAAASKPINQMEVGQELERRLVPALSEEAKQRAGVFANAVREAPQTIKRATGNPRFDELNQVLRPDQMETVRGVLGDLERDAVTNALASRGLPAAREAIGRAVPEAPPTGMFSPIISVTRGAYNRLTGKATDKIIDDLAVRMQDPAKMAELMKNAKPAERQKIVDAIMQYQAIAAEKAAAPQGER